MDDLHVRCHIVFARELLEAIRARIDLDMSLVRCHIVPTEITDVCVDACAHLASVRMITFFGTEIPDRALGIVDDVFARSIVHHLRLDFQRLWRIVGNGRAAGPWTARIAGIRIEGAVVVGIQCRCREIVGKNIDEIVVVQIAEWIEGDRWTATGVPFHAVLFQFWTFCKLW